jgi:hypothetical protein
MGDDGLAGRGVLEGGGESCREAERRTGVTGTSVRKSGDEERSNSGSSGEGVDR